MTIVFIGDVHQQWDKVERGLAALDRLPEAAVLLGDIQCERPLDQEAAPLLKRGIPVYWIFGNHDNDGGPPMWDNLANPLSNPLTSPGLLHARVTEVAGVRIAGLGGTFRPRIWEPPAEPRIRYRSDLAADVAELGRGWRPEHIAALMHSLGTTAIWPEDYDALSRQRADILVTHEAPGSYPTGKPALDDLARAMGVRLIIHGHYHTGYKAVATDGLQVLGVGAAWGALEDGTVLWAGDTERHLMPLPNGWVLEA